MVLRPALSERFALFKLSLAIWEPMVCAQSIERKPKLVYFRDNISNFFILDPMLA